MKQPNLFIEESKQVVNNIMWASGTISEWNIWSYIDWLIQTGKLEKYTVIIVVINTVTVITLLVKVNIVCTLTEEIFDFKYNAVSSSTDAAQVEGIQLGKIVNHSRITFDKLNKPMAKIITTRADGNL